MSAKVATALILTVLIVGVVLRTENRNAEYRALWIDASSFVYGEGLDSGHGLLSEAGRFMSANYDQNESGQQLLAWMRRNHHHTSGISIAEMRSALAAFMHKVRTRGFWEKRPRPPIDYSQIDFSQVEYAEPTK